MQTETKPVEQVTIPPIPSKMPFGKYKGKDFSELSDNYIAWLLNGVAKDPLKTNLAYWLLENKTNELLQAWVDKNYIDYTAKSSQ